MGEIKLNLARKWRSKQFEEIVGQDLSVRMLKNSLFLQHYFPVYLFAGQRGCGKTTTARVFATALNCEQLSTFRARPKEQLIPCLSCISCRAMREGKHPDFIEIDAASHTGVDHVRMLIDSSNLLPLMGSKKIYLIDEAHMLSKAAFNALLKVLEEPPASVIFMLATTDPHKILETVRSRCFQLLFRPVEERQLLTHLKMVCEKEQIQFDDEGLHVIIKQSDGSVRDALNLLETVRFSHKAVTAEAVYRVVGHLDDQVLISLFELVLTGQSQKLLSTIRTVQWRNYSATVMWERFLELIRASLWIKYGVSPEHFAAYAPQIEKIITSHSVHDLAYFLKMMYGEELLFNRTTAQHDLLEMILLQMCERIKKSNSGGGTPSSSMATVVSEPEEQETEEDDDFEDEQDDEQEEETVGWYAAFVRSVESLQDPLISSIFSQGTMQSFDTASGEVAVSFSKSLSFFEDWLAQSKQQWLPLLQQQFGKAAVLNAQFTAEVTIKKEEITSSVKATPTRSPLPQKKAAVSQQKRSYQPVRHQPARKSLLFPQEVAIDTSDKQSWPVVHLVTQYIPGTVTELRK